MKDNVIKCLLIKSFVIYKDNSNLNSEDILEVQEELSKTLNLSLYDLSISSTEIVGTLKNEDYENNISCLKIELNDYLGMFKNVLSDEKRVLKNSFNALAIVNPRLFDKGYSMDVLGYFLFSDLDEYSGENSCFVCHLLTSFVKGALNNKLKSTIYFCETFN